MRDSSKLPCMGIVASVLLALVSCGCRHPEPPPPKKCEKMHHIVSITQSGPGWDPGWVLGATVDVREYGAPCRLEVRWPVGGDGGPDFRVTLVTREGKVFPLPEGMVALDACSPMGSDPGGRMQPPQAGLDLDPPDYFAWVAPKPGDVFIPVGGAATVDGDFYAIATVEPASDATAAGPSVTVDITPKAMQAETYAHLHAGDTFRWGKRRATVVGVVEPIADAVGWVEIALTDAPGAEIAKEK